MEGVEVESGLSRPRGPGSGNHRRRRLSSDRQPDRAQDQGFGVKRNNPKGVTGGASSQTLFDVSCGEEGNATRKWETLKQVEMS